MGTKTKTNLRQFCVCNAPIHTKNRDQHNIDWTFEAAGDYLISHPEYQLCNLAASLASAASAPSAASTPTASLASASSSVSTSTSNLISPEDIRAQLLQQGIPFRQAVRSDTCTLFCCCACTDYTCVCRCPQDVLHRINLICAPFMYGKDINRAPLYTKYLLEEFTSEHPRYFVLYATLQEHLKSRNYGRTDERPDKLVYSPMFETEIVTKSHNKEGEQIVRKVVDPKTGYAKILNWPLSGVCPFCLPSGTLMRNRIEGRGDRKSKNWKEKFYENEY